jgi:hypothetical protein
MTALCKMYSGDTGALRLLINNHQRNALAKYVLTNYVLNDFSLQEFFRDSKWVNVHLETPIRWSGTQEKTFPKHFQWSDALNKGTLKLHSS